MIFVAAFARTWVRTPKLQLLTGINMCNQPNILFLFPDQWRPTYLGCDEAGVPVRTPNIDALAARGVRFTQCRTNSPLCAPARACLALGVRRHHTGVVDNGQDTDPERTTIFNRLQETGYWTAPCGKNDLHKGSNDYNASGWTPRLGDYGFDDAIDHRGKANAFNSAGKNPRGGCPYLKYLEDEGVLDAFCEDYQKRVDAYDGHMAKAAWPNPLAREHFTDDFCGRNAIKLLSLVPEGKPWFLWVNFPGPHGPEDPPIDLFERYGNVTFPPVFRGEVGLDHENLRRLYAASCEGIDEWCGRIIEAVSARGELGNTLVVFASDHGEMLGDHGKWGKSLWREHSVRVPLVVAGPGAQKGIVTPSLVELIDVGATFLDYAGAEETEGQQALSLSNVLSGDLPSHREYAGSELRDWRIVTDGRFKFVIEAGGEYLFDLLNDSQETVNLLEQEVEKAGALRKALGEVFEER